MAFGIFEVFGAFRVVDAATLRRVRVVFVVVRFFDVRFVGGFVAMVVMGSVPVLPSES